MECKNTPRTVDKSITLEQYVEIWRREIAPHKLAKSTLARDDQDLAKLLPGDGDTPAGVPEGLPENLNVHSLRHTNASLLIANGTDVATVAGPAGA